LLVEMLEVEYYLTRAEAAFGLAKARGPEEAIPRLLESTKDKDRIVRGSAVRALGEFQCNEQIVGGLVEAMREKNLTITASKSLGKFGPQLIPHLAAISPEEEPDLFVGATLEAIRPTRAGPAPR
jgi:hypothetical protein